jgi:hypothetical protein
MIRRRHCFVLAIIFAICAPASLWAWNFGGHMTTAAIAYDVLAKENPKALAAALAILKQNPLYDKMWAKQLENVDPENRDQALFMLAARWPDDIRNNPDYNHPNWHYIDYPFKPAGEADDVEVANPVEPNIETAFRENIDILKGDAPDADKAVALCWVMHLIGDCHQPLHSVSFFSWQYPAPKGDEGGNKQFIRAEANGEPLKLHGFWDGVVTGSGDTRDIRKIAIELRNKYPKDELDAKAAQTTPADFANWVQESFQLAKSKVYLDGQLITSPNKDDAPVVSSDYIKEAKSVGETRVTLAGYRMADILSQLFQ